MATTTSGGDAVDLLLEQHDDIRNLIKYLPQAKLDERDAQFTFLLHLLAVHETAEEEVIYPALARFVPDGAMIAEARKAEEDEGKKLLVELQAMGVQHPDFELRFSQLRTLVLAHAESEEAEVFPALRRHLPDDVVAAMRPALIAAEAFAPTRPHSWAPESALGNLAVGPVVAVVDRVRDAIRAVTH